MAAAQPPPASAPSRPAPQPPDLSLAPQAAGSGPAVKITSVTPAGPATAGGVFEFRVTARNFGGAGRQGGITVSAPGATRLSSETASCDVPTVADALDPGTRISTLGGGTDATKGITTSRDPLVELSFHQSWPAGTECTLTVRAPVPADGSLTFLLRAATLDAGSAIRFWPYGTDANLVEDQQGYRAVRWTVPVERP